MSGRGLEKPGSLTALKPAMGNRSRSQGLRDQWQDSSGKIVETCSILTTSPNSVTSTVRDSDARDSRS